MVEIVNVRGERLGQAIPAIVALVDAARIIALLDDEAVAANLNTHEGIVALSKGLVESIFTFGLGACPVEEYFFESRRGLSTGGAKVFGLEEVAEEVTARHVLEAGLHGIGRDDALWVVEAKLDAAKTRAALCGF